MFLEPMQIQTQDVVGPIKASAKLAIEGAGVAFTAGHGSSAGPCPPNATCKQEDAAAKQDTRMRQSFKTTIAKQLGISNHYTHIAVLIVHWASELDRDLKCWEEAQELEGLFRNRLRYEASIVVIDNTSKRPQNQLNNAVTKFILDNDGPEHSHLMIVYYTGHGYTHRDSPHTLIVSGTATGDPGTDPEVHPPKADWIRAAVPLDDAEADTLVILDCCFAGNIMKGMGSHTRAYEIMTAAGKDGPTESPGPRSYTRALIDSLNALIDRKQQPFTTWDLHHMIQRKRKFNTASLLFPGLSGSSRHIVFAPPVPPGPNQNERLVQRASHLDVRIAFADHGDLNDEQVASIAKELSRIPKATSLNVCDIRLIKFTSHTDRSHPQNMFGVTNTVLEATKRFRGKKRIREGGIQKLNATPDKRRRTSPALLETQHQDEQADVQTREHSSPLDVGQVETPTSLDQDIDIPTALAP